MSAITGRPGRIEQIPTVTQQQSDFFNQIISQASPAMSEAFKKIIGILSGSPEALEAFQAPELRRFHEQTIPGIAERFAGADAQSSSGFQLGLSGAAADLGERLSAQKAGLQQQAISNLQGLAGIGSQPQVQNLQIAGQEGSLPQILESIIKLLSVGAGLL